MNSLPKPVIYVARDIERTLGLSLDTQGYYIISNYSDFGKYLAETRGNVLLIKGDEPKDTHALLADFEALKFIEKIGENYKEEELKEINVLVFKNTPQIEKVCRERGWHVLNPPSSLSNKIEEKISQVEWLGDLARHLPPHEIKICKEVEWTGEKKIMQFNRAHTGSGTMLIDSKEALLAIQNTCPNRPVRMTAYINGPMFTLNAVVGKDAVHLGNISYQITGLKPFTDRPFATIGNDWGVVGDLLSREDRHAIEMIARDVGKHMRQDGWRGLFGIDAVYEQGTGKIYLIEINARQPASASFESVLQMGEHSKYEKCESAKYEMGNVLQSIFGLHIASLLNAEIPNVASIEITSGSQVVQRVTDEIPSVTLPSHYKKPNFTCIYYQNTKLGSDALRMQTEEQVVAGHNQWNTHGEDMIDFVKTILNDAGNISVSATLSKQGLSMIDSFLHLKIGERTVPVPYVNNKRARLRAGFRVMIGKGTPEEIAEEADILLHKAKIHLSALSNADLSAFLADRNLGIDCSGFVYHVLNAELQARGLNGIERYVRFPYAKTIIRKWLVTMRPVENINVATLAHEANSREVSLSDIRPGDMIVIIAAEKQSYPNHIILIHAIEYSENTPQTIHYTHSFQWSSDGKYGHGVRQGMIKILDTNKPLAEQRWVEKGKEGENNYTFRYARGAEKIGLYRLYAMEHG